MRYGAVFFDLDGTVADTLQNITDAVNHTMRQFGRREFSVDELKLHLGWGVDHLMRKLIPGIPEAEIEEIRLRYRPYYAAHTTDNVVPYPGILPMLKQLREAGLPLAIISNKPDSAVQPLHERYFRELVDLSVGERAGIARKPAPDMLEQAAKVLRVELRSCLYVGDTEVDLDTARSAGIDCVCVTWGFRSRSQLLAAGASRIVETPEELAAIILAP